MKYAKKIFVFGSNTEGKHGKGAALVAKLEYGAKQGIATGLVGNSYAIITKDLKLGKRSIPLEKIEAQVLELRHYVKQYAVYQFIITAIGCGLAGYTPEEIAPMFKDFPINAVLPEEFKRILFPNIEHQQIVVNPAELDAETLKVHRYIWIQEDETQKTGYCDCGTSVVYENKNGAWRVLFWLKEGVTYIPNRKFAPDCDRIKLTKKRASVNLSSSKDEHTWKKGKLKFDGITWSRVDSCECGWSRKCQGPHKFFLNTGFYISKTGKKFKAKIRKDYIVFTWKPACTANDKVEE